MTSRHEPYEVLDRMVTIGWRNRIVLRNSNGKLYWGKAIGMDGYMPVWLTPEEAAEVEELIKKRKP